MDYLDSVRGFLALVLGLVLYFLVSYVLPREFVRSTLDRHYRDWILSSNAYWRRSSNKWIINGRIYYIDEFWNDVLLSILCGLINSIVGALLFACLVDRELVGFLLIPSPPAIALLLFLLMQYDRSQLINSCIAMKGMLDPQFDPELEIADVVSNRRGHLKRIIRIGGRSQ